MIGSNALKKKSMCGLSIAEGNAKRIPSFAHASSQLKNDAILLMIILPSFVPNINHVIKSSNMMRITIGLHFICFY